MICPMCKTDYSHSGYTLSLELKRGEQIWTYEEGVCSKDCGEELMKKVQDALGDILMVGDIKHVS